MDSEAFTEVFEGGPEIPEREAVICKWIAKLQNDCPRFCALVIGQTGVGKSTLINNLLGEDVAGVGSNLTSCTPAVRSYEGVVEGVPVKLIDTPGLDDATTGNDERNVEEIRRLLQEETIHLIIYCTKISETRLHKGIIRTFKKYTEIGVDWEKTVIALTFADGLCPPSSMKEIPGFNIGTYFEDKVTEWRREISKALAEVVHLREEGVTQIKINPTISASTDLLPNGKEWYNAFWLDVLAVLPPGALMQFVHCHRQNIKCTETREAPEWPENFTLSPPPPDEKKLQARVNHRTNHPWNRTQLNHVAEIQSLYMRIGLRSLPVHHHRLMKEKVQAHVNHTTNHPWNRTQLNHVAESQTLYLKVKNETGLSIF